MANSQQKVAVKKVSNAFENVTDARRALREIKLLHYLRHENVVQLLDLLRPPVKPGFNELYLVGARAYRHCIALPCTPPAGLSGPPRPSQSSRVSFFPPPSPLSPRCTS